VFPYPCVTYNYYIVYTGAQKLGLEAIETIVLEEDGTIVDDTEVLLEFQGKVLLLLEGGEEWTPASDSNNETPGNIDNGLKTPKTTTLPAEAPKTTPLPAKIPETTPLPAVPDRSVEEECSSDAAVTPVTSLSAGIVVNMLINQ
jgi:hypothetical protein